MSLNNVRQYALMLVLLCGASGLPGMAKAAEEDCDMMSAVKKVDYGRYRKEDMRKASTEHVGKVYNGYASVTREFQVSATEHGVSLYGQRRNENRIQGWAR